MVMRKYVMFGGFDYPVKFEMNQNTILYGIDYFIDETYEDEQTGTYLGKNIYSFEYLRKQNFDEIFILIGSLVYYAELEYMLKSIGLKKDENYVWAFSWGGDDKCGRLWHCNDWKSIENKENRMHTEVGQETIDKYKFVSHLLDGEYTNVLELGAANAHLKQFLPERIKQYVPVDYVQYSDEHLVCDLNNHEFPEVNNSTNDTCVVMLGMFQYICDWKWLLKKVAETCDTFICSNNDIVRVNREFRKTGLSWNTAVFNHEIIIEMGKLGFKLVEAYDFRLKIVIMKFERELVIT